MKWRWQQNNSMLLRILYSGFCPLFLWNLTVGVSANWSKNSTGQCLMLVGSHLKLTGSKAWRHFAKHWQFGTSIIFQGHYLTNPKNALFTITTHLHGSIPKNGGNFMTPVLQTTWFGFNHLMLHQLRLQPSLWVTSLRIRTARNFRNSSAKKPSPCEKQH